MILLCNRSHSQELYFRSSDYADSISMQNNFPALAQKLIPLYHEPNKVLYYDNLFRLQLLAGDYTNGLANLDTAARLVVRDPVEVAGFSFFYKIFYQAKLQNDHDTSKPFSFRR